MSHVAILNALGRTFFIINFLFQVFHEIMECNPGTLYKHNLTINLRIYDNAKIGFNDDIDANNYAWNKHAFLNVLRRL